MKPSIKHRNILVNLTIDWEGEHLEDLNDFMGIRKTIGFEKPFTHFICPLYFLNRSKRTLRKLKTAILPHDEVAMHVHCYKPLVKKSGVKFRTNHDYYLTKENPGILDRLRNQMKASSGRGVPLSVYHTDEIFKIIHFARQLLQDSLNIDMINGFRAGGWLANNDVFKVLEELKFRYDSSVVPPEVISKKYTDNPPGMMVDDYGETYGVFNRYVSELWGNKLSQNGFLSNSYHKRFLKNTPNYATQPYEIGQLMEYPNNFGMTDFVDPKKSIAHFFETSPDLPENFIANYGCHMEGDKFYKQKLVDFLGLLKQFTAHATFHTISSNRKF